MSSNGNVISDSWNTLQNAKILNKTTGSPVAIFRGVKNRLVAKQFVFNHLKIIVTNLCQVQTSDITKSMFICVA